jgi:hypothetical protein
MFWGWPRWGKGMYLTRDGGEEVEPVAGPVVEPLSAGPRVSIALEGFIVAVSAVGVGTPITNVAHNSNPTKKLSIQEVCLVILQTFNNRDCHSRADAVYMRLVSLQPSFQIDRPINKLRRTKPTSQ